MITRLMTVLFVLAGLLLVTILVPAAPGDRVRIIRMNGSPVEGEMEELPNAYKVRTGKGITVTVPKNQVREIIRLETSEPTGGGKAKDAFGGDAEVVSDEEIAAILGEDWIESENPLETVAGVDTALAADEESIAEMMRIANVGPEGRLERDHFVLIFTSERPIALELASRLESVYKWVYRWMDMLDIEPGAPEHKLEIYFFADQKQYRSYGSTVGGIPEWAAGFYMRTINRSAFYDMNESDQLIRLREELKRAPWRARQYIQNRIKARQDWFNMTVIQHEAAHHIHFNTGVFPKRGDMPLWVVEGLAQMFELPPGKLGGSLGATNHFRLAEFHRYYNRRYGGNPQRLVKLRHFISDDSTWNPQIHYSYGWALSHYLWKKQRDKYAVLMQRMSKREEDKRLTPTEKQQEFEDIFGPADDAFQQKFLDYILAQRPRRSALSFLP